MNEPEDRPTTSDRPAPYGDPPEAQEEPRPAGGPPAEPIDPGESFASPVTPPPPPAAPAPPSFAPTPPPPMPPSAPPPPPFAPAPPAESPAEPEARWEDVVDPAASAAPEPPADGWPEPSRVRTAPPAAPQASQTAQAARDPIVEEAAETGYADDEYDDEPASRWVGILATIGTALIGIVTVQVVTSVVEGLTLKTGERISVPGGVVVPDDLLHRLGYPFGGLGATALVFLVLGIVLVSMPSVFDELLSESQERLIGVALIVAVAMGVLIAVGSLLAVRANLHEYAAKNAPVPSYVRVQFTNFLLGSLGAAALALFGSIASINERGRERL